VNASNANGSALFEAVSGMGGFAKMPIGGSLTADQVADIGMWIDEGALASAPTPTPTVTETVNVTPTETVTETPTVTVTETPTVTETVNVTPTVTVTETPTVTETVNVTPTVTVTETPTVTETVTVPPTTPSGVPVPEFPASSSLVIAVAGIMLVALMLLIQNRKGK
jgi:hypothetical protein